MNQYKILCEIDLGNGKEIRPLFIKAIDIASAYSKAKIYCIENLNAIVYNIHSPEIL